MVRSIMALIFGGVVMTYFALSAVGDEVKRTEEKTFKMTLGGYINVEGDEGFIKVNSWDKPEVNLVMTKRAWGRSQREAEQKLDKLEIKIDQDNNRLEIKVVKPRERKNYSFWDLLDPDTWNDSGRYPTVDFELTVPKQINLNLINDEGDVDVTAIEGDVEIQVDEGDIEITEINFNDMKLFVDEGDLKGSNLKSPDGRLSIEVDEGDIILDRIQTRRSNTQCDEGDIIFKNLSCNSCDISTDEGEIELELSLEERDQYRVSTDEGNVTFYLPYDPNVELDLETKEGSINSDFDIKIIRQEDSRICRDTLGNGKAFLEASTDEGTIYLRKK